MSTAAWMAEAAQSTDVITPEYAVYLLDALTTGTGYDTKTAFEDFLRYRFGWDPRLISLMIENVQSPGWRVRGQSFAHRPAAPTATLSPKEPVRQVSTFYERLLRRKPGKRA